MFLEEESSIPQEEVLFNNNITLDNFIVNGHKREETSLCEEVVHDYIESFFHTVFSRECLILDRIVIDRFGEPLIAKINKSFHELK